MCGLVLHFTKLCARVSKMSNDVDFIAKGWERYTLQLCPQYWISPHKPDYQYQIQDQASSSQKNAKAHTSTLKNQSAWQLLNPCFAFLPFLFWLFVRGHGPS